jgi:hypothetical protein
VPAYLDFACPRTTGARNATTAPLVASRRLRRESRDRIGMARFSPVARGARCAPVKSRHTNPLPCRRDRSSPSSRRRPGPACRPVERLFSGSSRLRADHMSAAQRARAQFAKWLRSRPGGGTVGRTVWADQANHSARPISRKDRDVAYFGSQLDLLRLHDQDYALASPAGRSDGPRVTKVAKDAASCQARLPEPTPVLRSRLRLHPHRQSRRGKLR